MQCDRPIGRQGPGLRTGAFASPGPVHRDLVDRADQQPQPAGNPLGLTLAAATAVPLRLIKISHRDLFPHSDGRLRISQLPEDHVCRGPRSEIHAMRGPWGSRWLHFTPSVTDSVSRQPSGWPTAVWHLVRHAVVAGASFTTLKPCSSP